MHQLSDIITALPHLFKPLLRNGSQLRRAIRKPNVDSRIPSYASRKPKEVVRTDQPGEVQRDATRSKLAHDDKVERRGVASTPSETDLSQSSTRSLAPRRSNPARSPHVRTSSMTVTRSTIGEPRTLSSFDRATPTSERRRKAGGDSLLQRFVRPPHDAAFVMSRQEYC
jgi:hypothetical protein